MPISFSRFFFLCRFYFLFVFDKERIFAVEAWELFLCTQVTSFVGYKVLMRACDWLEREAREVESSMVDMIDRRIDGERARTRKR